MICTFTAALVLLVSVFVQLYLGSSATVMAVALGYHGLIVLAGVYVDRLMSVGYFLEKSNAPG